MKTLRVLYYFSTVLLCLQISEYCTQKTYIDILRNALWIVCAWLMWFFQILYTTDFTDYAVWFLLLFPLYLLYFINLYLRIPQWILFLTHISKWGKHRMKNTPCSFLLHFEMNSVFFFFNLLYGWAGRVHIISDSIRMWSWDWVQNHLLICLPISCHLYNHL